MDELQAAMLRVKLHRLDADNYARMEIAKLYAERINNEWIKLPILTPRETNVYHIYPVMTEYRDQLQEYLTDKGIGTIIHYPIPPHKQACYAGKGILNMPEPPAITERLSAQELSIPLNPNMTVEQIEHVVATINDFQPR
jgi:dTDP-4-amino-4,6-dideoxygalactose transaminase